MIRNNSAIRDIPIKGSYDSVCLNTLGLKSHSTHNASDNIVNRPKTLQ